MFAKVREAVRSRLERRRQERIDRAAYKIGGGGKKVGSDYPLKHPGPMGPPGLP
jgi:hypothetical protein